MDCKKYGFNSIIYTVNQQTCSNVLTIVHAQLATMATIQKLLFKILVAAFFKRAIQEIFYRYFSSQKTFARGKIIANIATIF